METLLRVNTNLDEGNQLKLMGELKPIILKHRTFLEQKHRDGAGYLDSVLASLEDFREKADTAVLEGGESQEAISKRASLYNDIRDYIRQAKARAKMVVEMIEDDDGGDVLGVSLLRSYGIRGNQLNVSRTGHVERLLSKIITAHARHGELMTQWGVQEAFIERATALQQQLAQAHEYTSKERGEAEHATRIRNIAEEQAIKGINRLIMIVETFQEKDPQAFADFGSVLNKYRAQLNPSPNNNKPEEGP